MNKNLIKKLSYLGLTTLGMQLLSTSVYALEQEPSTVTAQEQAEAKKQLEASVNPLSETEATSGSTEPATEATGEAEESPTETTSAEETPSTGSTEEDTAEETTEAEETESTSESESAENESAEVSEEEGTSTFGLHGGGLPAATGHVTDGYGNVWGYAIDPSGRYDLVEVTVNNTSATIPAGISGHSFNVPKALSQSFSIADSATSKRIINLDVEAPHGGMQAYLGDPGGNYHNAFRGGIQSLDLSNLDVSQVTDMSAMFTSGSTTPHTIDVSGWNVSNVSDMSEMFSNCYGLTTVVGLSDWDVSNVLNMSAMFAFNSMSNFSGVENWKPSSVTDMSRMFSQTAVVTLDLENWKNYVSNVTDMSDMFSNNNQLTTLKVSGWQTSSLQNMHATFEKVVSLTSIDVSGWDTSNVTDMSFLFNRNPLLQTIKGIGNWDTSNVLRTDMAFRVCTGLEYLDLSNWDLTNVTNVTVMFQDYTLSKFCVVSNDPKILSYNFSSENRIPHEIKLDANGGTFSGGATTLNYLTSCAITPTQAAISSIQNWMMTNKPIPPTSKPFDHWNLSSGTTGVDTATSIEQLFGDIYSAVYVPPSFSLTKVPANLTFNGVTNSSISSVETSNVVEVTDTMAGTTGWELTATLNWNGQIPGDGQSVLKPTPSGTVNTGTGNPATGVTAYTTDSHGNPIKFTAGNSVPVMKATSGSTFDDVYSTDLGTIDLDTTGHGVAPTTYTSWTIDWNLAIVP